MIRVFLVSVLFASCVAVTGCAQVKPPSNTSDSTFQRNQSLRSESLRDDSLRVVAIDLISVLGQLPGFDPLSMTVQVSPTRTSFGQSIVEALSDAGYGIQRVSADQGLNHVEYKETAIIESTGKSYLFEIEIRGVRVVRNYERADGRWIPHSSVRIYGTDPTRIVVFDELHRTGTKVRRLPSGVVFHRDNGDIVESRETIVKVNTTAGTEGGDDGISTLGGSNLAQRALSLSQASTFTRQRASANQNRHNYQSIAEVILRFPSSNPEELGQNNKQAIAQLIQRANPNTDRFVIQGCVQGKTLRWDGTESLSLERQLRVNKELIISGVKPEFIQELGCFANESSNELPRQAVSVVLKRPLTDL